MATQKLLVASDVITTICKDMKYSRSHVAKILRENAEELGAKNEHRQWRLPRASIRRLKHLVKMHSGPRYKLGERGPHL